MAWGLQTVSKGLNTFEELLKQTSGKYCVGDDLTLADAFIVPQLYNAKRYGADIEKDFPKIHKITERLKLLPEFK